MSHVQQQIVELSQHLCHRGFFAATGGNLALRIDAQHIAVTPSATDYFTMRPEDVCVLRLKDLAQLSGDRAPTVESGLHAKILRARPDVQCSIHTHQPVVPGQTYSPGGVCAFRVQLVGRQVRQGHSLGLQRLPDA